TRFQHLTHADDGHGVLLVRFPGSLQAPRRPLSERVTELGSAVGRRTDRPCYRRWIPIATGGPEGPCDGPPAQRRRGAGEGAAGVSSAGTRRGRPTRRPISGAGSTYRSPTRTPRWNAA